MVKNHVFNDTSQIYDYIANYYEKKDHINFVLTNEEKITSPFYWKKVHQLLTSSLSNNDSKYRIFKLKKTIHYQNILIVTQLQKKSKLILKNHDSITLDQYMDLLF